MTIQKSLQQRPLYTPLWGILEILNFLRLKILPALTNFRLQKSLNTVSNMFCHFCDIPIWPDFKIRLFVNFESRLWDIRISPRWVSWSSHKFSLRGKHNLKISRLMLYSVFYETVKFYRKQFSQSKVMTSQVWLRLRPYVHVWKHVSYCLNT